MLLYPPKNGDSHFFCMALFFCALIISIYRLIKCWALNSKRFCGFLYKPNLCLCHDIEKLCCDIAAYVCLLALLLLLSQQLLALLSKHLCRNIAVFLSWLWLCCGFVATFLQYFQFLPFLCLLQHYWSISRQSCAF